MFPLPYSLTYFLCVTEHALSKFGLQLFIKREAAFLREALALH